MLRARAGDDQAPARPRRGAAGRSARPLVAFLAASAAGACARPAVPVSEPSPLLSHPVPAFRRPALDGSIVESAGWQGHVAVVDFFAEYCAPCARMLPSIEAMHHAMPDVHVIGISEDEDPAAAERVVRARGLTFPVVHDRGHALAGRFRVTDLPATFVVDAQGLVRWSGGGGDDGAADVRAAVESAR